MTDDELKELVITLEEKVWEAVIEKDGSALGKLFADDYIEITVDGKRIEKTELVEVSPQVDEIDGFAIDFERVVPLGENSAVLSYHLTLDGTSRGTTILPRERWTTSIWSRIDGRWLCRFFQQSPFHSDGGDSPWLSIPAIEYDEHLAHPAVQQRAFLDRVFAEALSKYRPRSVALLGCATGGGLEHIESNQTTRVVAVDLNPEFIEITRSRHGSRLPQLQLIKADLTTCTLDGHAFDVIHCALVLEYVDPDLLLRKIACWLVPDGVLVVVLQLHSAESKAVTETGCDSLKLLEPIMTLHKPDDIRRRAKEAQLRETTSMIERLESGKRFYVGHFTHLKPEVSTAEWKGTAER